MSGFDYPHTCPKIDRAIAGAKDTIYDHLVDIVAELSPLIPAEIKYTLAENWSKELYDEIEDGFETARESNSDMRSAAELQISQLQDEISQLQGGLSELENSIQQQP